MLQDLPIENLLFDLRDNLSPVVQLEVGNESRFECFPIFIQVPGRIVDTIDIGVFGAEVGHMDAPSALTGEGSDASTLKDNYLIRKQGELGGFNFNR